MTPARTRRRLGTATAALGVSLVVAAALVGPVSATPSGKVTICHATASASNPYVAISVDTSSIAEANHLTPNGHGTHTGPVFDADGGQHQVAWGDIIPAFSGASSYAGLNMTDAGTAILAHGCTLALPVVTPTPTTTTSTPTPTGATATPSPTETTATPSPTETSAAPQVTPTPTVTPTPSTTPTASPSSTPSTAPPQTLPSTGGSSLAHTGAPVGLLALLGAGLLGAGGLTLLAGRRRPALKVAADDGPV